MRRDPSISQRLMALAAVLAAGSAACLLAFKRLTGFAPHSIFCAQLGFEQGYLAPPLSGPYR